MRIILFRKNIKHNHFRRAETYQPIITNQLLPPNCYQPISSTNYHQPIATNWLSPTNCHQLIVVNQLSTCGIIREVFLFLIWYLIFITSFLPSFLSFFLSSFLLLIPHLICINQLLPINYHPPIIPQPIFINRQQPQK